MIPNNKVEPTQRLIYLQTQFWTCIALAFIFSCNSGSGNGEDGELDDPDGLNLLGAITPNLDLSAHNEPVMRRLTRTEYNNTIRDLLGIDGDFSSGFPEESRVHGLSNNSPVQTVSPVLASQYLDVAQEIAEIYVDDLNDKLPCAAEYEPPSSCAQKWIDDVGHRAYRRPLSSEDRDWLLDLFAEGEENSDFKHGIELALSGVLISAPFLYRYELGQEKEDGTLIPTSYEMASRLSYLFLASMPDEELFAAAEADALRDSGEILRQAERLVGLPEAKEATSNFHREWMELHEIKGVSKDDSQFGDFDSDIAAMLEEQAERFIEEAFWNQGFRGFFTSEYLPVNEELSKYLSADAPVEGNDWELQSINKAHRAGILTLPGLMALHALPDQSGPTRRGKFVRTRLLCQKLPEPPDDVTANIPSLSESRTTRERFEPLSQAADCKGCHLLMDPIGFGFEHFDATGRFREKENGLAIDSSGEAVESTIGAFQGSMDLGIAMSESEQAALCMALQWFRNSYGRDIRGRDADIVLSLQKTLLENPETFMNLLLRITQTPSFLQLERPESE